MVQNRNSSLDLIRAVAVTSVLFVHFFLNCGFYDTPCTGRGMAVGMFLRTQLMVCVPLFLLLTGYLQKRKQWTSGYYKNVLNVLIPYCLASLACSIFRAAYLQGSWSPIEWLKGLLSFSAAPYAWYIEMYIGLFLLIPFLNMIWHALPGKKAKRALLLSAVLLGIAPSVNAVSLHFGWQLLPQFWEQLYPIAYYFVGCYLQEVDFRPHWKWFLALNVGSVACGGLLHLYKAYGETVDFFALTYWNGIFPFLCAISLFVVLQRWTPRHMPRLFQKGIVQISKLSLPIFLISWIPERFVYGVLCANIPDFSHRLPWLLVAAPAVLLLSLPLAKAVEWLQGKILIGCDRVSHRLQSGSKKAKV